MRSINPLTARAAAVACLLLAGVSLAAATESNDARAAAETDSARPAGAEPGRYQRPEIQLFVNPDSEHWRSNYLPDSHHLDGYDARPDRGAVCAGASGRRWSTREAECPPGQKPTQPAQRWSTSP
jgi:hypothetical protein